MIASRQTHAPAQGIRYESELGEPVEFVADSRRVRRKTVSARGQFSLHVGKRCLFEIKTVSNDPLDPRVHALLPVEASEKSRSRGNRRRQWDIGGVGLLRMDRFSPSPVIIRLRGNKFVNFSLG